MSKCLVTKLNGTCNDDSLRKLGTIEIRVLPRGTFNSNSQRITLKFSEDVTVKATEGYFYDGLNVNLGTTANFLANTESAVYISNGGVIEIPKYSIVKFSTGANVSFDLAEFDFCPNLETFATSVDGVNGNILSIVKSSKLSSLGLVLASIKDNIADFANFPKLTALDLNTASDIYGDISGISTLKNLDLLNLNGTKVKGDIAALSNMNALKNVNFGKQNRGDLSKLPSTMVFVAASANFNLFTWGSDRADLSPIISMRTIGIADIDKMLISQAKRSASSYSDKIIQVFGNNKTSASDDAVSTLQSKGYTVSIMS